MPEDCHDVEQPLLVVDSENEQDCGVGGGGGGENWARDGGVGGSKACTNTSALSADSSISNILIQKKRLIFKYPDGTYSYAYRC